MALLSCKDVAFAYENQIVVADLNFNINQGEYLCIIGENGSGKTTLIKGLLGLKKPATGTITAGDGLKANQIGYVPQQTLAQKDFPASVGEVVLSGCLNSRGLKPGYGEKEKQRALDNMKLLGISELKNRCYRELSGGQQQRVLLARSLCATSTLLLLDEPTAGLDPIATEDFYGILKNLNENHGITIIMVSHDIKEAVMNASHILHLAHSSHFFGTCDDYQKSEFAKRFWGGGIC